MPKIVGFCGISNSGKTTLIEKITKNLINENKILCIKHDPKNKAVFDIEGKDSARFFKTGADVFISSEKKNAFFSHQHKSLIHFLSSLQNDYDYIFIEGHKEFVCPRICVARNEAGGIVEDELRLASAIVVDDILLKSLDHQKGYEIFHINDLANILIWIKNQAKELDEILQGVGYGYN